MDVVLVELGPFALGVDELLAEAAILLDGVVQFRIPVVEFHLADEELEPVGKRRVPLHRLGQRAQLRRVVRDERRVDEVRLHELLQERVRQFHRLFRPHDRQVPLHGLLLERREVGRVDAHVLAEEIPVLRPPPGELEIDLHAVPLDGLAQP